MKRDHTYLGTFARIHTDIDLRVRSKVLVIGELRDWLRSGRSLPVNEDMSFLDFDDLTEDIVLSVAPDVVLAPLLSRRFDCLDVAERLWGFGYRGRFLALAGQLPDPGMIRAEIAALFPGLDFDIVPSAAEV